MTDVLAAAPYRSNAELIAACFDLGYLQEDRSTLDPTYGRGTFWKVRRPTHLTATDLNPSKSPDWPGGVDVQAMPWRSRAFWATAFDGPYKLNGTPTDSVDERYGVETPTRWQDRMTLLREGVRECARVTDHTLLVKCQDQVCSGKVRWQTRDLADVGEAQGFRLVDSLLMLGGRAQPDGRRQIHARRNYSTLLVFIRGDAPWRGSTGDEDSRGTLDKLQGDPLPSLPGWTSRPLNIPKENP